jgi:hypothetical protein
VVFLDISFIYLLDLGMIIFPMLNYARLRDLSKIICCLLNNVCFSLLVSVDFISSLPNLLGIKKFCCNVRRVNYVAILW